MKLSPAQMIFGRPIKDTMPVKPGEFNPSDVWINCRVARELALRHKVIKEGEKWNEHTKTLPSLNVGQHVFIQNQRGAGKQAKRWDRTGIVTEDVGNDKYTIRVDGSGRVLSRNRRYLRSFKPALPHPTMPSIASKEHVIPYGRGGEEDNIAPNSVAIHDDIAPNSVAIPIVTPSMEHPQEPVVM